MATTKGRLLIGTGMSLGAAIGIGSTAEAAVDTITVTSLADPGDGDCATNGCTLREAITQADDGDTTFPADIDHIVFQSGLSGTITLNGIELPLIDEPLYIDGPGAGTLTVDGNDSSRILETDLYFFQSEVKIEGLLLTGGHSSTGGAISSFRTTLTLKNSTVVGNYSAGCGGGVSADHPIIIDSTISGNTAQAGGGGGLCSSVGYPVIENSIISGNKAATNGGGILTMHSGGIYAGAMTIEQSTISNNQAAGYGGGLSSTGNAIIRRSTISGNQAEAGGGGVNLTNFAIGEIEKSTISRNYSGQGAGVRTTSSKYLGVDQSTIAGNSFGGVSAESYTGVDISSSVVADNAAGPVADVVGQSVSAGFSLIENPGGQAIKGVGPNIIGSDPQLGPLAANGGSTQTMMPASTSPAIDQGQGAFTGTDQRGQPRVFDVATIANGAGDGTDIGAVELQSSEYVPPAAAPTGATGERDAAIKKCKKKFKGKAKAKKRKKCKKKAKLLPV